MDTSKVDLDNKIHKALVIITGNWSVRSNNQSSINPCRQVDMPSYRETQNVIYGRESKSKSSCVMTNFLKEENKKNNQLCCWDLMFVISLVKPIR